MGNEEIAREILRKADIQVHEDFPGGAALPDSLRPDIVEALDAKDLSHQKVVEGLQSQLSQMHTDHYNCHEQIEELQGEIERLKNQIDTEHECCSQPTVELEQAEALADELAEWAEHDRDCILKSQKGGRPTPDGGYEMLYGYGKEEKWYRETPICTCNLGKILDRYTSWKGGKK